MFYSGDRNDFAQKLQLLIARAKLRQEMGARGRDYAVKYSWDCAVNNLLRVWQEQIDKKTS